MMIKDNKGQISMEYLLLFAISLILLVVFTLPLTELTIENTLDVSDSLDMKSDLSKLSHAIQSVYGQGQGSRLSVNIISQASNRIDVTSSFVSCNLNLKNGQNKLIKINSKSNLGKTTIPISKGSNTIIVEWPEDSENMKIYKTK